MMKHFKRWIISCGLLLAALLTAGPVFASDITMVTYFPVPYAAYDNLYMQTPDPDNVTPRFTVGGKSDKEFTLNLNGQTAVDGTKHPSLEVVSGAVAKLNAPCADIVDADVRNTCLAAVGSDAVNKLQFDTDILTTGTATFGNTATLGDATMEFKSNLRINKQLGGDGAVDSDNPPLQGIHATYLNVDGTMNMITDAFVSNAAALPACDKTVSWNKLKFGGSESWFLTCGEGATGPEGSDPELCPKGYKWVKSDLLGCQWGGEYGGGKVYCEYVDNFEELMDHSTNCRGDYYVDNRTECPTPTTVGQRCIKQEDHIFPTACKGNSTTYPNSPRRNARLYVSKCK